MERQEDTPTPAEEMAVEYADIMERMISLNKRLITELAQYRQMDAEEKELEALVKRTGGVR